MKNDDENRILNYLADINKEACDYYKIALDKISNHAIKRGFINIENLHCSVVDDLVRRIQQNGGMADFDKKCCEKVLKYFYDVHDASNENMEEDLLIRVSEAEVECLKTMRLALLENDVQPRTRVLLFRELQSLQLSHDYISSLIAVETDSHKSNQ